MSVGLLVGLFPQLNWAYMGVPQAHMIYSLVFFEDFYNVFTVVLNNAGFCVCVCLLV